MDPLFVIRWYPVLLRVRTATGEVKGQEESGLEDERPADGAAPAAGGDKAASAEEKPVDLGTIRGLEVPRGAGSKPVFVYFHWPHEDGDRGKRIVKFCTGPLDDPVFVRVTSLFHCVEVNTRDSEERLVEEAKVRTTPTVLVCRPDGSVVWRSEEASLGGRALAEALKGVLRTRFPEVWREAEKEAVEQRKNLLEARRLLAAKKTEDAMGFLNLVVNSDVRYTEEWVQAVKLLREEEKK
ncbi:MAG: hypothetical protein L0323_14345, partial [Planctomycetes bacterium]|nr:hypothetical protein [Planctomycetota bacterium]